MYLAQIKILPPIICQGGSDLQPPGDEKEILWRFLREFQGCIGDRMRKGQTVGVKGLSFDIGYIRVIQKITG